MIEDIIKYFRIKLRFEKYYKIRKYDIGHILRGVCQISLVKKYKNQETFYLEFIDLDKTKGIKVLRLKVNNLNDVAQLKKFEKKVVSIKIKISKRNNKKNFSCNLEDIRIRSL